MFHSGRSQFVLQFQGNISIKKLRAAPLNFPQRGLALTCPAVTGSYPTWKPMLSKVSVQQSPLIVETKWTTIGWGAILELPLDPWLDLKYCSKELPISNRVVSYEVG